MFNVPYQLQYLYEPQQAFVERVYTSWRKGEPVVAQCGQRSGKTVIASNIVNLWPSYNIIGVSRTKEAAANVVYGDLTQRIVCRESVNSALAVTKGELTLVRAGWLRADTLVIIDEAFWTPGTEDVFDEFANHTPYILCVGSKGPHRWRNRKRIWRYATWDLNPLIAQDSEVIKHAFAVNPAHAERDYGSPEP